MLTTLKESFMLKKYLSEREASERYGYSLHWWRRKRWEGGGPRFIKMNRRIAYRLDDLESYFNGFADCGSTSEYNTNKLDKTGDNENV